MGTLSSAARNAACDAIVDLIDAGASEGDIRFGTTGMGTILATCPLNDPAFGDAATGVATMDNDPAVTDTIDNNGTCAEYEIRDSDTNVIIDGTCSLAAGGGDIEFDSLNFVTGGTCTVSSLTVTVPAS